MSVSSDDGATIVPSGTDQGSFSESIQTTGNHESGKEQSVQHVLIVPLESFSKLLCAFSFDEARSFMEKQATLKTNHATWNLVLQLAANIVLAEKQYMNLSFLAPKGFLRKECNLRSTLEHLRVELQKISEPGFDNFVAELIFFVLIRMDQIDFYEKLSLLGSSKNVEIEDLITDYEMIMEKFSYQSVKLAGVKLGFGQIYRSLGWEIESLAFLLKSHSSMQKWDFISSVSFSQEGQKRLNDWAEFLQASQSSKKSSFLASGFVNPALYTWLVKFRATLLSKFSLYFYDTLAQYSNPMFDIKMVSMKLQTDHYGKISSFVKKSDALAVCLIFDARETPFYPNGYSFPGTPLEAPTGLGSFPAVLAAPQKPVSHWPSVVMLITNHLLELDADKPVVFFDTRAQTTYFLQKVDALMYLLVIYESKRSEKDSQVIKFMQELASDLKCGKIFTLLRTGAK